MYDNVYIACPTHDGRIVAGGAETIYNIGTVRKKKADAQALSLIAANCNAMLANAVMNREQHKLGYFAMLHSDIVAPDFWIDKLIDIMHTYRADFVGAVVPLKGDDGLTSTAIGDTEIWQPFCRLSTKQVNHPSFPVTFDIAAAKDGLRSLPPELRVTDFPGWSPLWCNTGCCVVNLERLDPTVCYFDDHNRIMRDAHGKLRVETHSEDWNFTRLMAEAGLKVVATKALKVRHVGIAFYDSTETWGNGRDEVRLENGHK